MKTTPLPTRLAAALVLLSVVAAAPPPRRAQEVKTTVGGKTVECGEGEVEVAGVSFRCDPALFTEVWGGLAPEKPLLNKDDKPDYVSPERALFILYGPRPARDDRTFFGLPTIGVARLDDFAKAHALNPEYAATLDRRAAEIKSLLARRPRSFRGDVPLMPYFEGGQDFRTHLGYLRFRNGRGVAFLAHYSIEPTPVTNRALTYVFEGVTDDGLHYVWALFPVAASALHDDYSERDLARLGLDADARPGSAFRRQKHAAHVRRTERALARLPPNDFNPDLARLNRLLGTVNVRHLGD